MYPSLAYLDWIEGRPERAVHDLGSSDLRRTDDSTGLVPERLADAPEPDESRLREQIAAEYAVDPASVVIAPGASGANLLAVAAAIAPTDGSTASGASAGSIDVSADASTASTVESGHSTDTPRVAVERPGYGPLVATPRTLGAGVDRFERGELEPDRIAASLTDATRLVTVTNRHNPTGRLAGRDALAAVARAAREADALLHVDEVYAPYGDRTDGRTAFGGPTAAGLPGTIVTGSLTKFHGLGELRVGWLIAPQRVAERARRLRVVASRIAGPSRRLVARFFADRDRLVREARDHCRQNHEALASFAARSDLRGAVHDGAPYAALAHERADGDRVSEAAWAEDVLIVPGRFFDRPDQFRIALGRDPAACREALTVFGRVLDGL